MAKTSTDRIEQRIELKASPSRVWKALTDHREFGEWFRVKLESPFVPGKPTHGNFTLPGYEHVVMKVTVAKVEPERLFSFHWHPYAVDPKKDYSKEPPTLVEFTLTPQGNGVLLTVVESGFDKLPPERRDEAFRMNSGGWTQQLENIEAHVRAKA